MNKRDVAILGCRFLSLYAFYITLISLPGLAAFPMMLSQEQFGPSSVWTIISVVLSPVLSFIFAVILWTRAGRIASMIIKDTEPPEPNTNASSLDLQVVGFSILGLYAIYKSIPSLAQIATSLHYATREYEVATWEASRLIKVRGDIAMAIAELAVGLALLFFSRPIVEFLNRKHTA